MDYKCACDMRGMLSFHILWLLSRESMHGDRIAQELEKRRGEKPKAGTIYPALKDLKEKGLINGEREGKMIVYSLTPEGKKEVRYALSYFKRAFGDIIESTN
jgi:PadR family transcriptional regulator, regulatory protein PadR